MIMMKSDSGEEFACGLIITDVRERENLTTSPKAISNYTKLFGGRCNYLN